MTHEPEGHGVPEKGGITPGGLPQEAVEDRPGVGIVKPEDYPDAVESNATGSGTRATLSPDEEIGCERRKPGV